MRSSGWVLTHDDWCPMKKENSNTETDTHRGNMVWRWRQRLELMLPEPRKVWGYRKLKEEETSPLEVSEGAQPTQPAADFWAPELCGVQRAPIRPFLQQFLSFYEEEGWYSDMNRGESALSLGNAPSSMNMGCPSILSEIHFSQQHFAVFRAYILHFTC